MLVNLAHYADKKKASELSTRQAFQAAQKAETLRRVRLEWALAELLADIEAA